MPTGPKPLSRGRAIGHPMEAQPVLGERALVVTEDDRTTLVAADLHLGMERRMADEGWHMPSATEGIVSRLLGLVESQRAQVLALVGDIKDSVHTASRQEESELPRAMGLLSDSVEEIHLVNNCEVTNIRGRVLPLVRLGNLFGLPLIENGKLHNVVIVQSGNRERGIMVDALLGQQEIVIKALDEYIGTSVGIAGATILGDGRVVLIMDVIELMEEVRQHHEYDTAGVGNNYAES